MIRQICRATRPLGVDSRVFTLDPEPAADPILIDDTPVYQAKLHFELSSCSISLSALKMFKDLVDWADIVQYHFPWPFADVLHFAARVTKPAILTYHSDIVRQRLLSVVYRPLMLRFLGAMDRIICTSPNYFATSNVLPRFERRVEVIPIGLERARYQSLLPSAPAIPRSIAGPYFLFVGVLRYYKGLHILLEAVQDAPYRVVIVGSGPTEKSLKQQARDLRLENVIFAGQVTDAVKIQLLAHARAIVFPSYLRAEAFGVTLLEGAMLGKPLISTEIGSGTSHVNIHDETGLVVAPGSAKSLRGAMDQLFDDEQLAKRMGAAARRRFETYFSGTLMGERYEATYRSVLGIPERPAAPRAPGSEVKTASS